MIPRTWFWLGLILAPLLLSCAPPGADPATKEAGGAKSVLVIAESSALAMKKVLAAEGTVTHELPILNAVGAELEPISLEALSEDPQISRLVIDSNDSTSEQVDEATSLEAISWLTQDTGGPSQNRWLESLVGSESHGLTGQGIGLAIIDTGIAKTDERIGWQPNVIARYNALTNSESDELRDSTGHGTHITSLISGVSSRLQGIAPKASLIVVKAFDSTDNANFLDVIRAVQWVTTNKDRLGIRVLNLSVSASSELPYHIDPLNRALTKAWNSGLVVVVSAGNSGPDESTITAPGNNPWLISVGAASINIPDQLIEVAPFSGRGPTASGHIKPNIVAPGVRLKGLLPSIAKRPKHEPTEINDAGLWVTSGASQASAVVAGMVTLLLEARPDLSNEDVKCLLGNSASPLLRQAKTPLSPMAQGRGLINLSAALTSTATHCPERLEGFSPNSAIEGAYVREPR